MKPTQGIHLIKNSDYETQRISALHSYNITDTLNETEYDDIAKLAAAICDTPVSLVTFVDETWQWFKAKVGVDLNGTPRDVAFCEHTIRDANRVLVIEDAATDERFANNPLVTEDPNIRFYAGAPFTTEDGYTLGTVCVVDMVPRTLRPHQIDALEILSRQVVALLKTRKMNVDLAAKNQLLQGDNETISVEKLRLQDQLQTQASEHILKIATANAELVRINKELEAFAYISSHDLQEPLRKIQTFSSWLTENETSGLSDRGSGYLAKINASAARMQQLIQDLLNYSRVSMSPRNFKQISLTDIITPVLEDLQQGIAEKRAQIEVLGDGDLFVIEYQFRQLLHNLLSNALKFSSPDRVPLIRISLAHKVASDSLPSQISINLSDNGIGFDNQYNERIFSLFQRLGNKDKVAGTGIGLTIVRQIINNHFGTIHAYGKPNEGAEFTINIPVKEDILARTAHLLPYD